jgi:hypothetical protein
MAITIIELNKKLEGLSKDLETYIDGKSMPILAADALVLIRKRVQEKGLNANGQLYEQYSWPYAKRKWKAGKYKGFVDFKFTNRMWSDVQIVSSQADHEDGVAVISALKDEEKEKLGWNTDKKGDILALSKSETETIAKNYDALIQRLIKKYGL